MNEGHLSFYFPQNFVQFFHSMHFHELLKTPMCTDYKIFASKHASFNSISKEFFEASYEVRRDEMCRSAFHLCLIASCLHCYLECGTQMRQQSHEERRNGPGPQLPAYLSTTVRASLNLAANTSPMKYSARRPAACSRELRSRREQCSRRQSFSAVMFSLGPGTERLSFSRKHTL